MSDSKKGPINRNKRIREIEIQIKELNQQLSDLHTGKVDPRNILQQKNTTQSSDKTFYNDIINAPNREMYDLRNFHNFRSNSEYKRLNGQTKTSPNPNRSYYLSDICYSDSINYTGNDKQLNPDVQTIVINEFQPNLTVNAGKVLATLTDSLVSRLTQNIDTKSPDSLASILAQSAENVAAPLLRQKAIDMYSKNPSLLYGSNGKSLSGDTLFGGGSGILQNVGKQILNNIKLDPMEQIRYMFQGGRWLNTYELPFFNDTYLETCKSGTWSQEGINQTLSDGGALKTIMKGLNMDFPTAPVYKLTELGNAGKNDIKFSFYLINKDETMLLRNFQFLSAFFSGTQWVAMVGGSIVSPNVYNIHVPGRFQIYWATMKITVTCEGRLTRIPNLLKSPIFSNLKSVLNVVSPTHPQESGGPLWPEAWKVECDIHDLTLNNFNTFIDYYVDGWNQTTLASLEENRSVAASVINISGQLFDMAKQGVETFTNWATSTPYSEMTAAIEKQKKEQDKRNTLFNEAREILNKKIEALVNERKMLES